MEDLRYTRITDISTLDLDYANKSLTFAKEKLQHLNGLTYGGNIPKELLLDIHLTTDDIYLLEKRIGILLDQQLDDYHSSSQSYSWDKREACNKLREVINAEPIIIPLDKLASIIHSSLWRISYNDRLDVLRNFAVILGTEGYVSVTRAKELLQDCATYQ